RREANDRLRISELDCTRFVFPGAASLRASCRPAVEGRMSCRLDTGPAPIVFRNPDGRGSIDGMRLESGAVPAASRQIDRNRTVLCVQLEPARAPAQADR